MTRLLLSRLPRAGRLATALRSPFRPALPLSQRKVHASPSRPRLETRPAGHNHFPSVRHATNPPHASPDPPQHSDKVTESSYARPAHELSQTVTTEEAAHYTRSVSHSTAAQKRAPWMRVDSDVAPARKERGPGMVRGKLLTTPSRMLKLILPLYGAGEERAEPLALLVHPQQPLSYLERLIQSELPAIRDGAGNDKIPAVTFRAEDPGERDTAGTVAGGQKGHDDDDGEYMKIDGRMEKTGKLNGSSRGRDGDRADALAELEGRTFIRWSPSTEIGDFIRDASLGKIFTVTVEGSPAPVVVGVPSFSDRTFYLRMRLTKVARRIDDMAGVKAECDRLAHRSAQRVAQAGFAGLIGWWYLVYRLTFETELGWDVMEPVTYLVGLSTLIGGYMWFLYHNREVSYRAAMNLTVSKRQSKLYEQKGFDLHRWEGLVEEGNRLRREIRMVAEEYDTEWDEKEEGTEEVREALRKERKKDKDGDKKEKDEDKED